MVRSGSDYKRQAFQLPAEGLLDSEEGKRWTKAITLNWMAQLNG
jgi:hypothetical protein